MALDVNTVYHGPALSGGTGPTAQQQKNRDDKCPYIALCHPLPHPDD